MYKKINKKINLKEKFYHNIQKEKNSLKINKKNNNLINILFKGKNMHGDLIFNTNKEITPFLYGIRHKYNIINLHITSLYLKRVFLLINAIFDGKKKTLIIGNSFDIDFLVNNFYIKNNKNIFFINKVWINGLITNKYINKKYFFTKTIFCLIIIIKSSLDDNFLQKELSFLKVPIISLLGTKQNIKKINYPIISNVINIKSLYTLMYFFRKTF